MKPELRTLITDIKAAARIGHAESLWLALDGLLDLPEVAGNPQMSEAFLTQAVLPIGEVLSQPRLSLSVLRPLCNEPTAALRAAAAAAFARRYFDPGDTKEKDLRGLGQDPRKDVRLALTLALAAEPEADKLKPLVDTWIKARSPRLKTVAIQLLPNLPENAFMVLEDLIIDSDPEVRAAVVDALTALAQEASADKVLKLLERWVNGQENYVWIITKTLSGSWAAGHAEKALAILGKLTTHTGPHKHISSALQALERHGAAEQVEAALSQWGQIKDNN
jgi:hypothetical protein